MHARLARPALLLALLPLLAMPAAGLAAAPLPACLFDRALAPDSPLWAPPPGADNHAVAFESCTGAIRPGAAMTSPAGCTFNFVFTDAAANLYIGTAGHCTSSVGQRVSAAGVGSFGSVAYRRFSGTDDFTLIKIDEAKRALVSPTLCAWGGPVGMDPGTGAALPRDVLLEYGWGFATSVLPETRARAHAEFATYANHMTWNGVGSGGDSGAPVVNQAGHAMGIHTFGQTPFAGATLEGGPTIGRVLTLARSAVPSLTLVEGDPTNAEVLLGGLTY